MKAFSMVIALFATYSFGYSPMSSDELANCRGGFGEQTIKGTMKEYGTGTPVTQVTSNRMGAGDCAAAPTIAAWSGGIMNSSSNYTLKVWASAPGQPYNIYNSCYAPRWKDSGVWHYFLWIPFNTKTGKHFLCERT